jgi:hypothetical protein
MQGPLEKAAPFFVLWDAGEAAGIGWLLLCHWRSSFVLIVASKSGKFLVVERHALTSAAEGECGKR